MCISIPVSKGSHSDDSRLRKLMTERPRLLFALGWSLPLALFFLLPQGIHSLAILLTDGLLLFTLGWMAGAGRGRHGFQPMSPIRIGFSLWLSLIGGSLALWGGLSLVLGLLIAAAGAHLVISEWRWRRFWHSKRPTPV
ncbi:MAG: hypothetical protein KJ558_07960 [Gammaproteobacteria bacterium]|nr:hypothetical protein [Gammaproteobacteria bacterium]MBU1654748.1 hypothetical protein [Gammaproteobacteria bacterium]MBU1961623.1 hypothetical protein [Gammaproteobacteria bacterium]